MSEVRGARPIRAGTIDGKAVPGYRQEPGVNPNSATETFVALKLQVDNWRWSGVPFYLRSGKRLARSKAEIAIRFKRAPHMVFQGEKASAEFAGPQHTAG